MKDDERLDYVRYKRSKDIVRRDKPKETGEGLRGSGPR